MAYTAVEIPKGLTIYQGADWVQIFKLYNTDGTVIDLTGKTAKFQARANKSDTASYINLTTENSGIILGGTSGTVTLQMGFAATALLTTYAGFFDLFLYGSGATADCLCFGNMTVIQKVTT